MKVLETSPRRLRQWIQCYLTWAFTGHCCKQLPLKCLGLQTCYRGQGCVTRAVALSASVFPARLATRTPYGRYLFRGTGPDIGPIFVSDTE